jgi:hypothetical protein
VSKSARLDTTQPVNLVEEVRVESSLWGLTKSEFVGKALIAYIEKLRRMKPGELDKQLGERIRRGER